ncbi:MAG: hypothetical protein WBD40_00660 [Tepidisphaeraceae bacterium]
MAKQRYKLGIYEEIGEMMHAEPFQPFEIRTSDGDTILIIHPDFIARSPIGDTVIVYEKNSTHHRVVNLRQVVTIEPSRPKGTQRPGRR